MKSLKDLAFKIVRPYVIGKVDSNEDFYCLHCGKPVLHRILYCGRECEARANSAMRLQTEAQNEITKLKASLDYLKREKGTSILMQKLEVALAEVDAFKKSWGAKPQKSHSKKVARK